MEKIYRLMITAVMCGMIISCSESFLETTDTTKIGEESFPTSIGNIELLMGGIYSNRSGGTFFTAFPSATFGQEHFLTDAKTDDFILAQTNGLLLRPGLPDGFGNPYYSFYQNVKRANSVLEAIEKYRLQATDTEIARLDLLKGEALINRAVDYYYLAGYYSEALPHNGDFLEAKGLVLHTAIAKSVEETITARSTVKATYEFIESDLLMGMSLLGDHRWPAEEDARFDALGAKALLAKVYVILEDWARAKTTLKEVIDSPETEILPFDQYKAMWVDGNHKINTEVLLAVNSPKGRVDSWNNGYIDMPRFFGPSYWIPKKEDGVVIPGKWAAQELSNWGMGFYPDQNIARFGFKVPVYTSIDTPQPAYIAQSVLVRDNKSVDPRLWVNAFQIWVDSVTVDNVKVGISYPREIIKDYVGRYHVFNMRKYMDTKFVISDNTKSHSQVNFPIIRMADIYLLYAEVLIKTNEPVLALEYINKIKRRAYGADSNTPTVGVDYLTLTSPTMAPAIDKVLSNNPLRYERWAELQGEAVWWLDIRRWRLGQEETDYYKFTTAYGGTTLAWADHKYAWPIPSGEIEASVNVIEQNPGY